MVLLYLQVTSNEKQNTLWRPADKPIRKDQQDRFFWLQDYRFFLNQLRQLSAISCCKRLPSIGSVTHWITRGKKSNTAPPNRTKTNWQWMALKVFQCPSLPFLSVEGLGSIIIFILLSLPFNESSTSNPPCRHNSCCTLFRCTLGFLGFFRNRIIRCQIWRQQQDTWDGQETHQGFGDDGLDSFFVSGRFFFGPTKRHNLTLKKTGETYTVNQ